MESEVRRVTSTASNAVGDRLVATGQVKSMSNVRLRPLLWDLDVSGLG